MSSLPLEFILRQLVVTEGFDLSEVEALQRQLNSFSRPNFLALELGRIRGSNTLTKGSELARWQEANQCLQQWLESDDFEFGFPHIVQINQILHPAGQGKMRTTSIFAGLGEFANPADLCLLEDLLQKSVLSLAGCPIMKASQVYQWLSTFHPFQDANGRTARLAADYILLAGGYVPFCFESPFDAMSGVKSNTTHVNGNYGMKKAVKWLANAYRLLLLP
jgi:hypothetical protein